MQDKNNILSFMGIFNSVQKMQIQKNYKSSKNRILDQHIFYLFFLFAMTVRIMFIWVNYIRIKNKKNTKIKIYIQK